MRRLICSFFMLLKTTRQQLCPSSPIVSASIDAEHLALFCTSSWSHQGQLGRIQAVVTTLFIKKAKGRIKAREQARKAANTELKITIKRILLLYKYGL
jgi:hypothetical protein